MKLSIVYLFNPECQVRGYDISGNVIIPREIRKIRVRLK